MTEQGRETLSELRARAVSGEADSDEAINTLLAELYVPVVRFLERRLVAPAARAVVPDLAQDVLVRVYRGLPGCRAGSDAQLMAWVLSIARRTAADWLRSPHGQVLLMSIMDDTDADMAAPDESDSRDDGGRSIVTGLVSSAYSALPANLQELLWLRLVRGLEWAEIAHDLRTTQAGAKRQFQRVQRRLLVAVSRKAAQLPHSEEVAARAWLRHLGSTDIL